MVLMYTTPAGSTTMLHHNNPRICHIAMSVCHVQLFRA